MIRAVCTYCGHVKNVREDRKTSSLLHSRFSMQTDGQEYVADCVACKKYTVHRKLRKSDYKCISDLLRLNNKGKNVAKAINVFRNDKKRVPRTSGDYTKYKDGY